MILIIFYREVFDLKDLNSSFIDNIKNYSSELKLNVIKSDILDSINEANENNLSYEEFLANLLQKEVDIKNIWKTYHYKIYLRMLNLNLNT